MLEHRAAIAPVVVNELVDGLVTDLPGALQEKRVGDLFRTPVLLEESNDLLQQLGGMAEADSLPPSPGCRIALRQRSAVGSVTVAAIASALPEHSTGRATNGAGDFGYRFAAFPKGGDAVSFFLRELSVPTQWCVPFLAETDVPVGLQLSQFHSRALHLVLEFAQDNMSLQLSPRVHN